MSDIKSPCDIGMYSFNLSTYFSGRQLLYAGQALENQGYSVNYKDMLKVNETSDDKNFIYPFHYWKTKSFDRNIPLKKFKENDVPIGFTDSDIFYEPTLRDLKQYNYRYFGALSQDTANIMNLPRTKVIHGCYNPAVLRTENIKLSNKPMIYINGINFYNRRGIDIALEAIKRVHNKYEFNVKLRTYNKINLSSEFDYITQITGSMQDNAHYSQIATSDIMLAPIRGGAFEFQVLEALIMGKTVVLSTKGGWSEIPLKNDVYWIESGNRTFPMTTDYKGSTYHYGNIYQVDVEKTVTALEQALNKPKVPDKNYYIRNYSPKAYAEKLIRFYDSY